MKVADLLKKLCMNSYFLVVVFFIATYITFGFHWGWIDDVFMLNSLKGSFIEQPSILLFSKYHIIQSAVLLKLYKFLPNVSWYEWLLYLQLFFAVSFFFRIMDLVYDFQTSPKGIFSKVGVSIILFLLLFVEPTFMIDFTTVAGLLIVSSSTLLFVSLQKRDFFWENLLCIIFLAFGISLRPELVIILSPLLAVLLWFFKFWKNIEMKKTTMVILSLIVLLFFWSYGINQKENRNLNKQVAMFQHLLDGNNSIGFENALEIDSARTMLIFSWFSGDQKQLLDPNFIQKLEIKNSFQSISFLKMKNSLKDELWKSMRRYTSPYTLTRNWLYKVIPFYIVLILFLVLAAIRKKQRSLFATLMVCFLSVLIPAVIGGVIKLEYRIMLPLFVACVTVVFVVNNGFVESKKSAFLLIGLLIALVPSRVMDCIETSSILHDEVASKENFIQGFNNRFQNKVVLFDLWTMSLNRPKPFSGEVLDGNKNHLMNYGELFSNFIPSHVSGLVDFCGTSELVPFFQCLDEKGNVIFAITNIRASSLTDYFKDVHDMNLELTEVDFANELNEVHYSFLWEKLQMNYYTIESLDRIE